MALWMMFWKRPNKRSAVNSSQSVAWEGSVCQRQSLILRPSKKICNDPAKLIDLQLYYVECGIEFTNTYGDINESFYNSMGGMYEKVVNGLLELRDIDMIRRFEPRLSKAVDDTEYIGWGFGGWLSDSYLELKNAIGEEE